MDPLKPELTLLVKLGSFVVHTEEFLSPKGHEFDLQEIKSLLIDPEVKQWLKEMGKQSFLPVKR